MTALKALAHVGKEYVIKDAKRWGSLTRLIRWSQSRLILNKFAIITSKRSLHYYVNREGLNLSDITLI